MTLEDLEQDTPALLRAMLAAGGLWGSVRWQLSDVSFWLWSRDEPERSEAFAGTGLPCPPVGWREDYARALVASAVLAEWLEQEPLARFFVAQQRGSKWYPTDKAKKDLSPLTGVRIVADSNVPGGKGYFMANVDYASLELRTLAALDPARSDRVDALATLWNGKKRR